MENNTVQNFLDETFGEVRTVLKDNEIWFVATDIAKILGLTNISKALENHREDKDKTTLTISYSGNMTTNLLCVSEQGLYKLIFKSRKPFAEQFQDWICETVIPALRKDGGYIDGEEKVVTGEMSEDELIYKAMHVMDKKIKRLEEEKLILQNENEELKPIASLVDKFINTNSCYDVGTYAKMLESKDIGRDRLFAWLREKKILMSGNIPYQQYTQYFKVVPTVKHNVTYNKTLIRPIGVKYIYNRLIKDGKMIVKPLDDIVKDLQEVS